MTIERSLYFCWRDFVGEFALRDINEIAQRIARFADYFITGDGEGSFNLEQP